MDTATPRSFMRSTSYQSFQSPEGDYGHCNDCAACYGETRLLFQSPEGDYGHCNPPTARSLMPSLGFNPPKGIMDTAT